MLRLLSPIKSRLQPNAKSAGWLQLPRRRPALFMALGTVFVAAIVAVFIALVLSDLRRDAIADNERELQNTAFVIAEEADRAFQAIELLQTGLIERMQSAGIATSEEYERRMSGQDVHLMLREKIISLPHVNAVGMVNADGKVINSSYVWPIKPIDVADREYFKALKNDPHLRSFIGKPIPNRNNGSWIISVARKFPGPNNEFVGLVMGAIEMQYFEDFFKNIALGSDAAFSLYRDDGTLLAREPRPYKWIGRSTPSSRAFTANVLAHPDHRLLIRQVATIDGQERLIAGARLAHYPVIVAASKTVTAALAVWRRQAQYLIGLTIALIVAIGGIGAATSQWLRKQNDRLDTALNNMHHALLLYDRNDRLLVANRRYIDMYGLSPDKVKPGCSVRELLEQRKAAGTFKGDIDEYLAEQAANRHVADKIVDLPDGRVIQISNRRTADGGWVSTQEDITERQKAQQAVNAARAEAEAAHVRLRSALEVIPEGLVIFDAADRFVLWNDRYTQIFCEHGIAPVKGMRYEDFLRARFGHNVRTDVEGHEKEWLANRLKAHAQPHNCEEYRLKDDRWMRLEERRTPDGGSIGIRVDITELKRREASFRLLFESNPIPMWVHDRKALRFLAVNDAAIEHYGYSREQFLAMTILDVRPAEDREEVRRSIDSGQNDSHSGHARRHLKADGTRIDAVVYVQSLTYEGHQASIAAIVDVTERERAAAQIAYMARHDPLTDLANRSVFLEKMEEALLRLNRSGESFNVFLLDLDLFKAVNDSLGHPAGDELLKAVAQRLQLCIRQTDTAARLGGDEFAILQPAETDQREGAMVIASRLLDAISAPYDLNGHRVHIGASIGIALAPEHATDSDQLLKNADLALYKAKSEGRNDYRFFEAEIGAAAQSRQALETDLRNAISQGEFELHYHPVIDTATRETCGVEALVRWPHPQRGMIFPDDFIPFAEETGLISPLGEWVLRRACADAANWPPHIKVAVNLSPVQFKRGNLVDIVSSALAESGLPPERLELEITESVPMEGNAQNLGMLHQLRSLGVAIVLDDFGTGYATLGDLRMFPFDKIKIDRSFVSELSTRADCAAIICSVTGLGRSLNIVTVAEGVETEDQLRLLRAAGCTQVQGFLFGRPCPASELDFTRSGEQLQKRMRPDRHIP